MVTDSGEHCADLLDFFTSCAYYKIYVGLEVCSRRHGFSNFFHVKRFSLLSIIDLVDSATLVDDFTC